MPLPLKLAGAVGSLGAVIGPLAAIFFGATLYTLAIGTILGCMVGFVIGYRIGQVVEQVESVARAERFVLRLRWIDAVLGWVLVAAGTIALVAGGWNLSLFLATSFFAICSLYLTYRLRADAPNKANNASKMGSG